MWIFYIILAVVLVVGAIISLAFSIRTFIREGGWNDDWASIAALEIFGVGITISGGVAIIICLISLVLISYGII